MAEASGLAAVHESSSKPAQFGSAGVDWILDYEQFELLHYPDSRLRRTALPVETFNAQTQRLADDMLRFMYEQHGAGLAAPQIAINRRILVIDISENKTNPLQLFNPEIIERSGLQKQSEGCLSVPGLYFEIERAKMVRVKGQNARGEPLSFEAEGYFAVAVQHEMDHLDGILNLDYLSPLKQKMAIKKLKKIKR